MGKKNDKTKEASEKAEKAGKAKKAPKKPDKKPVDKKEAKPVTKPVPVAPPKTSAPAKPKAAPKKKAAVKTDPSFEEIQLHAYYVAERRMAAGLPGDSASDWIQAEKELRAG